ncbi:M20/M25/M40 family metallo-hydrolase [Gemmobacter lanyuensis]
MFQPGSAAEGVLAEVHEAVLGTSLEPHIMPATSDTRFYDLYYGIPALCYGGIARGMHAPDEGMNLHSLQQTTEVIARFILDWCGVRPRKPRKAHIIIDPRREIFAVCDDPEGHHAHR